MSAEFRPTSNRRKPDEPAHAAVDFPGKQPVVNSPGKQPVETEAHGIVQARGDAHLHPALCGNECARAKTLQDR